MKKIAVCVTFMNDKYRQQIDETAAKWGFEAHYYDDMASLAANVSDCEIIYSHPDPKMLKHAANLKWLCSDFAGIEKYLDESVWPHPGCLLTNSSGAYGPTISEHIVMVYLMLLRRMPEYLPDLSRNLWTFYTPIRSIIGSKVVMLGTGDIGRNTARRLKAMGASVTGVCRSGKSEESAFDRVVAVEEMGSVLSDADALIVALPATGSTMGIVSREHIAKLSEKAFVINVGRGATIDQDALVDALQSRKIAGAALDVMVPEPLPVNHPLWSCPNTIITPHTSGNMSLGLTCDLTVEMFCRNLAHYAQGEPLENLVDRTIGY